MRLSFTPRPSLLLGICYLGFAIGYLSKPAALRLLLCAFHPITDSRYPNLHSLN